MTFETIPGLLADLLQEQRDTRAAIASLAEALAGVRATTATTAVIAAAKASPAARLVTATAPAAAVPTPSAPAAITVESTAGAPSYQDAAVAITNLSKTKGREVAVALLNRFDAAKLPEVKPEQFADLIAAVALELA